MGCRFLLAVKQSSLTSPSSRYGSEVSAAGQTTGVTRHAVRLVAKPKGMEATLFRKLGDDGMLWGVMNDIITSQQDREQEAHAVLPESHRHEHERPASLRGFL